MISAGFNPSLPDELNLHVMSYIQSKHDLLAVALLNRYFVSLIAERLQDIRLYRTLKKRVNELDKLHLRQNIFWRYGVKLHALDPRLTYRSNALLQTLKFMNFDHPERKNVFRKIDLILENAKHRIETQKTLRLRRLLNPKCSITSVFLVTLVALYCLFLLRIVSFMIIQHCRWENGMISIPMGTQCYLLTNVSSCLDKAGENATHLIYQIANRTGCHQ